MIHKYKLNDYNIIIDVESGTVLTVDPLTYELLGEQAPVDQEAYPLLEQRFGKEAVEGAIEEIRALQNEGLLYAVNNADLTDYAGSRSVKALCLHVAHDCNLRCEYCFAAQGDFKGDRLLMEAETGKRAIDYVAKNSGTRKNIEIDFFGGEPLMNLDVVKEITAYARSIEAEAGKKFNFTITTNGVLLNEENRDWLNENMDNIVLSLDGRREVNDAMRKTVNGKGSYDLIKDDILAMAELREGKKDYYVRGTYTAKNLDFANDVRFLADEGFKSISVEPVVAEDGCGYELTEDHVETLKDEYDRLGRMMLEDDCAFNFFHFNIDLDAGPCVYKRLSGCGAGVDYLAVTPTGELYPCHQFVGNEDFCLGDLKHGIVKPEVTELFKDAGIDKKADCSACWCRYFCGGGCHANAWNFNHDLKVPYHVACELEKRRVENAVMLYIAKASEK